MGIQNFEAFVLASIMLNLIPGPDTFYILGRSMSQGRTVGIASALGISGGAIIHTLAAAVGLSAIIIASPTAFAAIKWIGAAYLIFLGIKMLFQSQSQTMASEQDAKNGFFPVFRQGVLTNALNPKVALFFLAFLPQFVDAGSESHLVSFLILGMTFVLTSTLWGLVLAFSAATISARLRANPRNMVWLNRVTGSLLVGLGVRLAVDRS